MSAEKKEAAIVLLAAGEAKRFGGPKQLHPWRGVPLVRLMAEKALASRAGRLIVVTGAYGEAVAAALAGLPLELAANEDFGAGQSSSVRRGLAAAAHEPAILFLPADMPHLEVSTLDRLLGAWADAAPPRPAAVVPRYAGERGAPVLFDRRLFPALAALEGDRGGRAILARHPDGILEIAIADPRQGADLDTPEDLAAFSPDAVTE